MSLMDILNKNGPRSDLYELHCLHVQMRMRQAPSAYPPGTDEYETSPLCPAPSTDE